MKPILYYCYDAYCGWCYGFSPVIKKLQPNIKTNWVLRCYPAACFTEQPQHIGAMAGYISTAYKHVEETTGIKFGESCLWHIQHPEESDWYPETTKPAIALCIFKEYHPDQAVAMAADLQYALN